VKVIEKPELVNSKPYDDGWMLRVKLADKAELQKLLSADDYRAHIGETPGSGGD
jgi:glycine cleavage system H protein